MRRHVILGLILLVAIVVTTSLPAAGPEEEQDSRQMRLRGSYGLEEDQDSRPTYEVDYEKGCQACGESDADLQDCKIRNLQCIVRNLQTEIQTVKRLAIG